ncbi:MAG: fluoride exporter, partial [Thermoleophilaceae bacterium]|nr:fluoride exporter [Thermoleophilaceae bacterium]
MTAATLLGIGALGGLGALLRFGVSLFVATHTGRLWLGTLAVNLSGSFTLGLLGPSRLVGTGLLGAFTTFSAWMYETRVLSEGKRSR